MKNLTLFLILMFLNSVAVFTFERDRSIESEDTFQYNSDPQFTHKITGSDEDGFDILVSYPESNPRKCRVSVEITMFDNSTQSFTYNNTVNNTGSGWAWFDGKAGLKPAPIKKVEIKSKSCD